jgi:hypothetical protein
LRRAAAAGHDIKAHGLTQFELKTPPTQQHPHAFLGATRQQA